MAIVFLICPPKGQCGVVVRPEPFKANYFLMGYPETKIQLSFKVRIIEDLNLYFGYTQLMKWGLFHYFKDLNFNPEFFYRFPLGDDTKRGLDFGIYEHMSNGKGGAEERAWNRTYLRYYQKLLTGASATIVWSIKAWIPYWYKPGTEEIVKYRGVWETEFTLSDFLGPVFENAEIMFRLFPGGVLYTNPFLGGQELTFQFKMQRTKFLPLISLQFFHGYGESLLNFEKERWAFRAGLGFSLIPD